MLENLWDSIRFRRFHLVVLILFIVGFYIGDMPSGHFSFWLLLESILAGGLAFLFYFIIFLILSPLVRGIWHYIRDIGRFFAHLFGRR